MSEQPQWYGAGGRFRNKIYVGNLSSRTRESDIKDAFKKYGQVSDIVLKYDFAFVEMANEKDMQDAIDALDGYQCNGRSWLVEHARRGPNRSEARHSSSYSWQTGSDWHRNNNSNNNNNRNNNTNNNNNNKHHSHSRRGAYDVHRRPAGMRPIRGEFRIQLLGLSSATSWQDLKDFARGAGESVCYGDVFVDGGRRIGIVEYNLRDDYLYALKHLNGDKLHGKKVSVYKDGEAPAADTDTNDIAHDDNHDNKHKDDDTQSNKSSPRLHDNERHKTRRSYYGGSRAYGSSSTSHKKDAKGHRQRTRRRHRHRSPSVDSHSHSSRSRTRTRSRSRSHNRHKTRHRTRREHHHRRRSRRRHRDRDRGRTQIITTKTHLSNSSSNTNGNHEDENDTDTKHKSPSISASINSRSKSKSKSASV